MTNVAELAELLAEAQRSATSVVDPTRYAALDLPTAVAVQTAVTTALNASVGMIKTAIRPDGAGVAAPIYSSRIGRDAGFELSAKTVIGLEVEVGMVLARDVRSPADIPDAIDHFFLGVEVCGTRFTDRTKAGAFGGLADAMFAYGYCLGPRRPNDAIEGLTVRLSIDGQEIYEAPVKQVFGNVTASLSAYAGSRQSALPLTAGTVVTTGSISGLVPISGTGRVVARLGDESLTFKLIE